MEKNSNFLIKDIKNYEKQRHDANANGKNVSIEINITYNDSLHANGNANSSNEKCVLLKKHAKFFVPQNKVKNTFLEEQLKTSDGNSIIVNNFNFLRSI